MVGISRKGRGVHDGAISAQVAPRDALSVAVNGIAGPPEIGTFLSPDRSGERRTTADGPPTGRRQDQRAASGMDQTRLADRDAVLDETAGLYSTIEKCVRWFGNGVNVVVRPNLSFAVTV